MSNRLKKGNKGMDRHPQEKRESFETANEFLDLHFGKREET